MSRETSKALLVLDRLVSVINEDVALHPDLWFVAPATMTAKLNAQVRDMERPLVAFEMESTEPVDAGVSDGGTLYRERMEVTAWLETDVTSDPQESGLELASDFRRFLGRHRQLEADDGDPWMDCGQILDRGYAAAFDFDAAGGAALIEFHFSVEYYWNASTA